MPLYALLLWIVIGAAAGWLAQRLLGKVGPYGLIGDIVVGIVGAVVGGYVLGLLGMSGGGGVVASFVTALIGALLLVYLLQMLIKAT